MTTMKDRYNLPTPEQRHAEYDRLADEFRKARRQRYPPKWYQLTIGEVLSRIAKALGYRRCEDG